MRRWAGPAAVAASFVFFAARLLLFVERHAVNILFWDQFDYLRGLREHAGAWQLFSWTHGPHRMGLGYFFIAAVYGASGWDERVEAFATVGLMMLASAVALLLAKRIRGRLSPLDACIPALVLTTAQFEIFIGTPNAAHGPIPLLLALLAPLLWLVRSAPLRALLGGALAFCAAFTGFALFLVPLLAALFLFDERPWNFAGAALCAASLAAFFAGYHFQSAADCFRFPAARPLDYLPYAGLMALRPLHLMRVAWFPEAIGVAVAAAMAAVAARALAQRTLRDRAVFLLAGFSLLFIANSAIGRVCLGVPLALSPRYVPYVLPLWLAAYFAIGDRRFAACALAGVIVGLQIFKPDDRGTIRWYAEGKARWRECFLRSGDEAACNRATSFRVYPVEGAPQVREMFDYLKANRLNLYRR